MHRSRIHASILHLPPSDLVTDSAEQAYQMILTGAGTSCVRAAGDKRIVAGNEVRTHHRIDSQKEVGGWPPLESGPAQNIQTGMGSPNAWETERGLNFKDLADSTKSRANGSTNPEHDDNGDR